MEIFGVFAIILLIGGVAYLASASWHKSQIKELYGNNPTPEQLEEYWNGVCKAIAESPPTF